MTPTWEEILKTAKDDTDDEFAAKKSKQFCQAHMTARSLPC